MGNPSISIIIPTFLSASIQETISAIDQLRLYNDEILEVLIVGQQENLIFPDNSKNRYIRVDVNPSPARNRNIGALEAKGEWLCFLDSDCIPQKDWIIKILLSLTTDDIYVGSIDLQAGMPYWSWCDHLLSFGDQVLGIFKGRFLRNATTNNLVVKRNLFIDIGGFDESFTKPAGEDYDFCTNLLKLGLRIVFIRDAIVIHNHIRKDFFDSWNHLFLFGESTIQRRLKNRGDLNIFQKTIYHLLKNKFLGYLFGIIRIIWRAIIRPIHRPYLLKFWKFLPGIIILDFAHTQGMISYVRANY